MNWLLEANWTLVMSAIVLVSMGCTIMVSVWLAYEHSLLRATDVQNDNKDAIRHFLAVLDRTIFTSRLPMVGRWRTCPATQEVSPNARGKSSKTWEPPRSCETTVLVV